MKGCLGQAILFLLGAVVAVIVVIVALAALAFASGGTAPVAVPPPVEGQADISLTISESYLNRQLQSKMAATSIPLISADQIALSIQPEGVIRVAIGIQVPVAGEQQLTVDTQVTRDGNRVKVAITKVSSGIIPVPQQVLGALEEQLNNEIQGRIDQEASASLNIMDVQTTDHAITVKATVEG